MALGQSDPARLEGDALRRWYLRSPAEVEEERRGAAARSYNSFFSQLDSSPAGSSGLTAHGDDGLASASSGLVEGTADKDRRQGYPRTINRQALPISHPGNMGARRLAAATPPTFWDYWGVPGCSNCHGYRPDTLPPVGGHIPFPPSYSPRAGGPGGSTPPEPHKDYRKQCDQQLASDSIICGRQINARAKADCRASAMDRMKHCLRRGEVGTPGLRTYPGASRK